LPLSFDASSPLGCCLQSHEQAVIGWKPSRKEGKESTQQTLFSTKFAAKLNFMPCCSPVYFIFPVFGFWCHLCLTLCITLLFDLHL
jgi:hypothetical protein